MHKFTCKTILPLLIVLLLHTAEGLIPQKRIHGSIYRQRCPFAPLYPQLTRIQQYGFYIIEVVLKPCMISIFGPVFGPNLAIIFMLCIILVGNNKLLKVYLSFFLHIFEFSLENMPFFNNECCKVFGDLG